MRIISIGEILWDVHDKQEFIGGAPFNFSVNLRRLGHNVNFISAVGKDERGNRALLKISYYNLSTKFISRVDCATGYVSISKNKDQQPNYVIHNPAAYHYPSLTAKQVNDLIAFQPQWLYFGTLNHMSIKVRKLTYELIRSLPKIRCFYDINLRNRHYSLKVIKELLSLSSILKLNSQEIKICSEIFDKKSLKLEDFCKWIVDKFKLDAICITMGSEGCSAFLGGRLLKFPGYKVNEVDPVGAGDAFAAGFLHGVYNNWSLNKTCGFANRLGAINTKKYGSIPEWKIEEVISLQSNN